MVRDRGLEHPEIGWIERTGYPSWMQESEDDDDFYDEDDDDFYDEDDRYEDFYNYEED